MNERFDNANVAVFMLNIMITCTFSITGTEIDQNDLFPLEPTPFKKRQQSEICTRFIFSHTICLYFVAK